MAIGKVTDAMVFASEGMDEFLFFERECGADDLGVEGTELDGGGLGTGGVQLADGVGMEGQAVAGSEGEVGVG